MERLREYRAKVTEALKESFQEEHSPKETALSFSLGIFITCLPTFGAGLIVFALISKISSKINKIALFSSILVINPVIKPLFYLGSVPIGSFILSGGLQPTTEPQEILAHLIAGSVAIGISLSILGYFIAVKAVERYQEPIDEIEEIIQEEL